MLEESREGVLFCEVVRARLSGHIEDDYSDHESEYEMPPAFIERPTKS